MELTLKPAMFEQNKYTVTYGQDKEALFTIVDEEFAGTAGLTCRVNKITILTRTIDAYGNRGPAYLSGAVIGLGDGVVGVQTEHMELLGKILSKDNMEQCTIILYEG